MTLPRALQGLQARHPDALPLKVQLPADLLNEVDLLLAEVGGERFKSALVARLIELGLERVI